MGWEVECEEMTGPQNGRWLAKVSYDWERVMRPGPAFAPGATPSKTSDMCWVYFEGLRS